MEDMMVGKCFEKIFAIASDNRIKDLIIVGETVDHEGRERFHPLTFRVHFNGPSNKTKREWIHSKPFHHNLFVSFNFLFDYLSFYLNRVMKQSVKQQLVFIIQNLLICIKLIHYFMIFDNSIKKCVFHIHKK